VVQSVSGRYRLAAVWRSMLQDLHLPGGLTDTRKRKRRRRIIYLPE